MTSTQQTLALFSSMEPTTDVEGRQRMDSAREAARPVARRSDPETSHSAGDLAASNAENNRQLALRVLREAGPEGLTDFELSDRCGGIPQTSIGRRRGELRDLGLVRATDERRPSPNGATCIVWAAV